MSLVLWLGSSPGIVCLCAVCLASLRACGLMSQGRATSRTSAVGELADDDEVRYIFSQRRKAGGKLEYLCKVASGEPVT